MMRWTSVGWFRTCTTLVLAAFFSVYGVNLSTWVGVSTARAADIDDLLDADDSDLLEGLVDEEDVEEEAPAPAEEAAKPAPTEDDEDDYDGDEAADDAEDDAEAEDEAEPEDDEPVPAKPVADDDYDEEDEEEYDEEEEDTTAVEAALPPEPIRPVVLGPRKDGRTRITPVVFAANDASKRRSVEVGLLVRDYFRSAPEFTHVAVNDALLGEDQINEDAQVAKAKRSLTRGIEAYDRNELGDAIDDLEKALTLLGPVLDYPEYRPMLVDALIYLGASYILDGEPDEGHAIFTRLLQWDRSVTLEGRGFPPRVTDEFEDASDGIRRAPRASMSVTSAPPNSAVFVDGYFRGLTPISLDDLSVGDHFVKLTEPAYKDYQISLTLFRGVPKSLPASLQESTRYYQYRGEMATIERSFQHARMWEQVQALGGVLDVSQLFLVKVSESGGVVTLVAHYYDLEEELYKNAVAEITLARTDFDQAVLQFIDLVISERVKWADTYIPPEEKAAAAEEEGTPVYKTWWLWTIVGVVVAAGVGAGVYFGLYHNKGEDDGLPSGREFPYPNSVLIRF